MNDYDYDPLFENQIANVYDCTTEEYWECIDSVSNMADGFECFMDSEVTTYLASSDKVVANGSRFTVTDATSQILNKAHRCLCSIRVEDNLDGSFIITVVEA